MTVGYPTLYLNENIDVVVVRLFAQKEVAAIHTRDVGNLGQSDEAQLAYAVRRGYVLLTHNRKDFLRLHQRWIAKGKSHPGIITARPSEPENLVERVCAFLRSVYPTALTSFCLSPPELLESNH